MDPLFRPTVGFTCEKRGFVGLFASGFSFLYARIPLFTLGKGGSHRKRTELGARSRPLKPRCVGVYLEGVQQ